MMMERQRKCAIAASLFFMALATFVILGTHSEAVAEAGAADSVVEPTTEWMALPAARTYVGEDVSVHFKC